MIQTITYKHSSEGGGKPVAGSEDVSGVTGLSVDLFVGASTYDVPAQFTIAYSTLQLAYFEATQPMTLKFGGTDEIQQVAVTGTPTGGSFTLTFSGQTTAAIAYNATASTVQTAIAALSNVGTGKVTAAGGPLPGTPVTVTWKQTLGKADQPAMTFANSLTGGTSPTPVITTPTPGVAPTKTINLAAGIPAIWTINSIAANPFSANLTTVYVTNATANGGMVSLRALGN